MNDYPLLARALLDCGDAPQSIVAFLRADYGLDRDQAKAAIVLARHLETEPVMSRRDEPRTRSGTRR